MVNIRFATEKDAEGIRSFLRENWKGSRVLIDSRRLFDFQYMHCGRCCFVIAIDDETGVIYGIKGYIPLNDDEQPDIAAALAMVLQGIRPMLGMEIEGFLEKETHSRWVCSVGINPNTSVRVYRLFKNRYLVDTLRHYYRLGDVAEYRIASIANRLIPAVGEGHGLIEFRDIGELSRAFDIDRFRGQKPYKSLRYIDERFFKHPLYRYRVLGIMGQAGEAHAVIIGRIAEANGARAFRIVDYLGDRSAIAHCGRALDGFMTENGCELTDFYCYGMPHEAMTQGGFLLKQPDDENIIPNYYEPFVQKNVDIYFFATGSENALICKADGDQDRPNILPEDWYDRNK